MGKGKLAGSSSTNSRGLVLLSLATINCYELQYLLITILLLDNVVHGNNLYNDQSDPNAQLISINAWVSLVIG